MRLTRIHVPGPLATGSEVSLPPQAGDHLVRVLRLAPGAPLTLFDGAGGEYAATISAAGKTVRVRVQAHDDVERESPLEVTLLQGIARGERMDLIVQKATELGVRRVVPLLTERSVVRVDAKQSARKHAHWQSVAVAACEQCGRNRVPQVDAPIGLGDAIAGLPAGGLRCLLAADATRSLAEAARSASGPITLLVGPEGGLAEGERKFALAKSFEACRLGPRIMRTETAGFVALAVLQTVAGDFA